MEIEIDQCLKVLDTENRDNLRDMRVYPCDCHGVEDELRIMGTSWN